MLYENLSWKKYGKRMWICALLLPFMFSYTIYAAGMSDTGIQTFGQKASEQSSEQVYKVVKGDTLYQIAKRFGVTVQEITSWNQIADPNLLQIGQKLIVSKAKKGTASATQGSGAQVKNDSNGSVQTARHSASSQSASQLQTLTYQVSAGDTLYQIAANHDVSVQQLIKLNHIRNPHLLRVGQQLLVPVQLSSADLSTTMAGIGGKEYAIGKVLNSTLTAYTAGFESTGKTPDHPEYGITFSGKRVQEGRTIAVDPSTIELGSLVYIEGIGLRTAEDIGSAIKGTKIDIFMEDLEQALEFGVKKNVKVYVLEEKS